MASDASIPYLKQPIDDADHFFSQAFVHLIDSPGEGKVHQNGAEAHGHQQGRLKVLDQRQVDQQPTDNKHDQIFPAVAGEQSNDAVIEKTELL